MEELDLGQLLELFWNKKTEVILIILLFIVIGITYTVCLVTPKYTSKTTLLLATEQGTNGTTSSQITTTDLTLNSKLVATYRDLVKSTNVARQVISNLNLDMSEDTLKGSISVQAKADTDILEISVTNTDPELAARIANELAPVFSEKVKEYYNINNVHVVDVAEEATSPSNINHAKDIIIFAFIGIVVAVAYVLIANMLDTTVKSAEDIEKLCSVTVLASIPQENFENKRGGKK